MDESVSLFHEEHNRNEQAGGFARRLKRKLRDAIVGLATLTVVFISLLNVLGMLPRNADHSIMVMYYGPLLTVLGVASGLVLRSAMPIPSWIRPSLWLIVALAAIGVPAGIVDAVRLHGG